jgi:8-oxo-dGTP diphosphatase
LGSYVGPDSEVPGASVAGEYYVLRDVPADALVVTEGSLLIVERNDLIVRAPQFAPSATAAFGMLISKGLT